MLPGSILFQIAWFKYLLFSYFFILCETRSRYISYDLSITWIHFNHWAVPKIQYKYLLLYVCECSYYFVTFLTILFSSSIKFKGQLARNLSYLFCADLCWLLLWIYDDGCYSFCILKSWRFMLLYNDLSFTIIIQFGLFTYYIYLSILYH